MPWLYLLVVNRYSQGTVVSAGILERWSGAELAVLIGAQLQVSAEAFSAMLRSAATSRNDFDGHICGQSIRQDHN